MKRVFILLWILIPGLCAAQPITGLNFREWYNPDAEISVSFSTTRLSQQYVVDYTIEARQFALDKYSIVWERRDSYTQRDGATLTETPRSLNETEKQKQGEWLFPVPAAPWLLIVKVTNLESKVSWTFFERIDPKYPANGWLEKDQVKLNKKYITLNQPYQPKIADDARIFVSVYFENFPSANPPFVQQAAPADRFMFYDSTFQLNANEIFTPKKPGVYLFQRDTNAAEGFAYMGVRDVYPKFSNITDLVLPMLYITTPEEFDELIAAGNEKSKFDKVVLDITGDKDRARTFMRSYFRRVELANTYFTSYKHGWKTDRGMIYTIFGLPDEVSINDGTETWFYKSSRSRFTFVKRGSVYDPNHYVLLRDKRFTEAWFSTIDLWRKSRF